MIAALYIYRTESKKTREEMAAGLTLIAEQEIIITDIDNFLRRNKKLFENITAYLEKNKGALTLSLTEVIKIVRNASFNI
ncbi:MAG: hypothetical protein HN980_00560 [Waddliaceae bacterium]|jgi:hypothetical protein|nr:hypothetical protein [Waddliaceae bacterium]MBT7462267.1 hypothetical protein [Waddliaceae bacterium]